MHHLRRLLDLMPRINHILLFLLLVGGMAAWVIQAVGWWGHDGVRVAGADAGRAQPAAMRLDDPEAVRGSDVLLLRQRTDGGRSAGYGSGEAGRELRNVLFLVGAQAAPHWLFKSPQNLLRRVEQVSGDPDDPEEGDTAALYVEYADADTDGDQRLTLADRFTVALARPDGTALQVLLTDVERVYQHTLTDAEQLTVLYQKAGALRQARFNPRTGAALGDQSLVKLSGN